MKRTKRILALLLIPALMIGLSVPIFADKEEPLRYLAVGDSTASGYATNEYCYEEMSEQNCGKNPRIYANLFGDYLEKTLGREVEVTCIIPQGLRTHDLRALLDPDFSCDQYYKDHINGAWKTSFGGYEGLHNSLCDAIENTDLMTIDACMASMGNYVTYRVKSALGVSGSKDYDSYFGNDLLANYYDGQYASLIASITSHRTETAASLKSLGIPVDVVSKIIDTFEYAAGMLMINFSKSVEMIYEMNEDIDLIVLSPFVTADYTLTLAFGGVCINLSSIIHSYISPVYDYMVHVDPNRDRYKLADLSGTLVSTFMDRVAEGDWENCLFAASQIRNTLLSYGLPVDGKDEEQDKFFRETVCPNMEKVSADTEFDLTLSPFRLIKLLTDGQDNLVASMIRAGVTDYDHASVEEKLVTRLVFAFNNWSCHPDYEGHRQKFEAVQKAFDSGYSAKYARLLKVQANTQSFFDTLRSGGSLLDYIKYRIKTSGKGIISPRLFLK